MRIGSPVLVASPLLRESTVMLNNGMPSVSISFEVRFELSPDSLMLSVALICR